MHAATFAQPDQRFVWQRSQLAPDVGDCYSDSLLVEPGLSLVYSHYLPTRHLLERSQIDRKVRGLTFTVALEGRSSVQTEGGDRIEFLAGHNTVTTMKSGRGERRFLANEKVRQLRLIADEPVLQNYGLIDLLHQDSGLGPSYRILFVKQGAGTRSAAERLVQLHAQGGSPIDVQIATLTLLSEHARTLKSCDAQTKPGSLSNADQDRIGRARDLIMTHYTEALTVAYVCSVVGINEFKLKQGFRDYFGTSPHRLLVECRMQKAWQLLEAGARVSSTAYQVGYQHVSSFSKAFQLFFGRAPKSVSARV